MGEENQRISARVASLGLQRSVISVIAVLGVICAGVFWRRGRPAAA
jgi:hypothetical protein